MTNKELIDLLEDYFMNQHPQTVARALASMFIDLNRILNLDSLPESEKKSLKNRIYLNVQQLKKFIKDGGKEDFVLMRMNSDEGD